MRLPPAPLRQVVRREEIPMDDEGFLRAIIAEPEDDALRLVYADWLEDHDRSERARLIRVQCELARLVASDAAVTREHRATLEAEVGGLLRTHKAAWLAELPYCGGVRWQPAPNDDTPGGIFERGFVSLVSADNPSALERDGERAFAAAPVQRLFLVWLGPRAARKFARWPLLTRLRSLEARGAEDRSVAELARSPHLTSLRRLKLDGCGITSDGLQALAEAGWLGDLAELDLRYNRIGDSGARALAGAPHLGRLRCLDLRSNPLSTAGRDVLRERFARTAEGHVRLLLDDSPSG
jgi:uncharacterized protein (TIGR02996 family)